MKEALVPVCTSLVGHGVGVALVLATLAYAWQLCLMLLLAWCVVTLGVAANLGVRDMPKLCNAHWLLAASQVFALGSLISVNAWRTKVTISPELQGLRTAPATQHVMQHLSAGVLLFQSDEELMLANLSSLEAPLKVSPALTSAHSFSEFEGRIVFAARQGTKQQLWYIDSSQCCTAEAVMLRDFGSDTEVETILVQNSILLIRTASPRCNSGQHALFSMGSTWEEVSCISQPGQDGLLGALLLAALPTTLLSCWALRWPGLFPSFFLGIYSMMVIIRLLTDSDLLNLHDFISTSLVVYCSVAYLGGVCWHFLRPDGKGEFKEWSFAVISLAFSAALQLRLDLPGSSIAWRWIIFGAAGVLQMLIGQLVRQRWPKLMGLICLQLCVGRAVLEFQLDVGSAARQAFQLGFLGLAGGSLLVLLDWSLDPEEVPDQVHPEAEAEPDPGPSDLKILKPQDVAVDPGLGADVAMVQPVEQPHIEPEMARVQDHQEESSEQPARSSEKLAESSEKPVEFKHLQQIPNSEVVAAEVIGLGLDAESEVQSEESI